MKEPPLQADKACKDRHRRCDPKRRYEKPTIVWEDDLVSKIGLANGCAKVSENPLCGAASTS